MSPVVDMSGTSFIVSDPASENRADEDAAVLAGADPSDASPTIAVLVDGAGVPPRYRAGCAHPVAWYSRSLAEALAARLGDRATPMRDALAGAIAEVAAMHEDVCDLDKGGPSGTVVAIRQREGADALEHLVLCDSSLLIVAPDGGVRRITDTRIDDVVAAEPTADRIEARRNAPGGFWVARHEVRAADEAIIGSTPLDEVGSALLVSDGITRAVDLLGIADDAHIARRCTDPAGAEALIADIRGAERDRRAAGAPMPRKTHDDATVIRWTPADR